MTDKELCKRLREGATWDDDVAAADRIEALTEARDTMSHLWAKEAAAKQVALGRIEALTAKLAAAEAGLLAIAKRDEQMIWGEDYEVEEAFKDMRDIALATLAEIKGESHE